tara:strand:- start:741 stop:1487 length:747 start_codon:yes stop_codon:yes gene_type:complete
MVYKVKSNYAVIFYDEFPDEIVRLIYKYNKKRFDFNKVLWDVSIWNKISWRDEVEDYRFITKKEFYSNAIMGRTLKTRSINFGIILNLKKEIGCIKNNIYGKKNFIKSTRLFDINNNSYDHKYTKGRQERFSYPFETIIHATHMEYLGNSCGSCKVILVRNHRYHNRVRCNGDDCGLNKEFDDSNAGILYKGHNYHNTLCEYCKYERDICDNWKCFMCDSKRECVPYISIEDKREMDDMIDEAYDDDY